MTDRTTAIVAETAKETPPAQDLRPVAKPKWETPKLEDVSEEVMAQPYIRFT